MAEDYSYMAFNSASISYAINIFNLSDLGYECCLKKVGVNCWVYVYTLDGGLYPDSTPFSAYQPQTY